MENLGLSCLTTRRVRSDLIQTFKIINGIDKVEKTLFFRNWSGVRRGHSNKLFKKRSRLDIRKYAFSNRTVDKWKSLTQDCINCTTINTIKCHIQKLLDPGTYRYRCTKYKKYPVYPHSWSKYHSKCSKCYFSSTQAWSLLRRRSGILCWTACGIRLLAGTVSDNLWRRFCLQRTDAFSALEVSRRCAI